MALGKKKNCFEEAKYIRKESCHVMYSFRKPDTLSQPESSIPWLSKKVKRKNKTTSLNTSTDVMMDLQWSELQYLFFDFPSHPMFPLHPQGLGEPTWKSFIDSPSNFKTYWSAVHPSLFPRLFFMRSTPQSILKIKVWGRAPTIISMLLRCTDSGKFWSGRDLRSNVSSPFLPHVQN